MRAAELYAFFPDSVVSVQDFSPSSHDEYTSASKHPKNHLREYLVWLLEATSFVIDGDRNRELRKLRFWTFQIRGHYSERNINSLVLERINNMISQNVGNVDKSLGNHISVHYRLGDLLNLKNKSPIENSRVVDAIRGLQEKYGSNITLYSDSPKHAESLLKDANFSNVSLANSDPVQTLWNLVNAKYLVGTNSKISVWAVILDTQESRHLESFLPREIQHHILANVGRKKTVTFY